jgi:hypothetical protein
VDLFVMLIVSRLVDPFTILAGVVPYFGIRNAPWRSLAGAAAAGAFVGIVRGTTSDLSLSLFGLGLASSIAAACGWWAILHFGRRFVRAKEHDQKARSPRPRLVRDEDDWRK